MQSTVEDQSDDETDQFSTIKRSPKDAEKKSVTSPIIQQEELTKNQSNKHEYIEKEEIVQQISEQQIVDEIIYGDFSTPGLQAKALYDYQAGKRIIIVSDLIAVFIAHKTLCILLQLMTRK